MPNTRDIVPGEKIFALFKGDPGTGKGVAAASFPGLYVMDLDHRIRSVKKMFPNKDIEYDQFNDLGEVLKKIEKLANRCDFETVHIASLTKLANMAVEYSMKFRGVGKGTPKEEIQGLSRGQVKMTDVSDWGVEFRALSQIIDALQTLPCHVILEAHVLEVTRENVVKGTATISRSLMTGAKKIAAYIPTCFDEAYHFFVETPLGAIGQVSPPKFLCATTHMGDDWAKTALHLPPLIDWTGQDFYSILRSYVEKPYDPSLVQEVGVIP